MKLSQILKIAEAKQGFDKGEKWQWTTLDFNQGDWFDLDCEFIWEDASVDLSRYTFRKKLEPKLRQWKPEEAIGKIVRSKQRPPELIWQITSAGSSGFYGNMPACHGGNGSAEWYLKNCEQLDGSPCGVQE